ncbi:hypothetical protein STEG23_014893 [Scotinomys teguina]
MDLAIGVIDRYSPALCDLSVLATHEAIVFHTPTALNNPGPPPLPIYVTSPFSVPHSPGIRAKAILKSYTYGCFPGIMNPNQESPTVESEHWSSRRKPSKKQKEGPGLQAYGHPPPLGSSQAPFSEAQQNLDGSQEFIVVLSFWLLMKNKDAVDGPATKLEPASGVATDPSIIASFRAAGELTEGIGLITSYIWEGSGGPEFAPVRAQLKAIVFIVSCIGVVCYTSQSLSI